MPPGKGRVTKLSAPPPVVVLSDPCLETGTVGGGGAASMSGLDGSGERDMADLSKKELAQERRSLLMKLFADTGTAKIPAVLRYCWC